MEINEKCPSCKSWNTIRIGGAVGFGIQLHACKECGNVFVHVDEIERLK